MNNRKPHQLLYITAAVFALLSLFTIVDNRVISLQMHDTYIVTYNSHIFFLFALMSGFTGLIYHIANKRLFSHILTWIHIALTVITLSLLGFKLYRAALFQPDKRIMVGEQSILEMLSTNYLDFDHILLLILSFICGMFLFILNLALGLIKSVGWLRLSFKTKNDTKPRP